MTISSRTPEGDPIDCPVCGASVKIEPSRPFGDAPCPSCGHLLWFVHLQDQTLTLAPDVTSQRKRWATILAQVLNLPEEELQADAWQEALLARDSIDLVGLVMKLEEQAAE